MTLKSNANFKEKLTCGFKYDMRNLVNFHPTTQKPENFFSYKNTEDRRSSPEVFCKKGVLRNFTKFTGKHLCQSLFFNKVAGLRPAFLLKKRLWHICFPVNFVKFLRAPFYIEHLWWLLLRGVIFYDTEQ